VCGYPATVHGGLTAAIIDESLGGLYTCMLTSGSLGVRMPALTARLEVDYRKKIPAGSIILVQVRGGPAEVEECGGCSGGVLSDCGGCSLCAALHWLRLGPQHMA
jgi:hypothetical protein